MLQRYQIFLVYGVALIAIWKYCFDKSATIRNSDPTLYILITFSPIIYIVVLGLFLLLRLVLGVLAFEDCPDAAKQIDLQIAEATTEMKRRKIIPQ